MAAMRVGPRTGDGKVGAKRTLGGLAGAGRVGSVGVRKVGGLAGAAGTLGANGVWVGTG